MSPDESESTAERLLVDILTAEEMPVYCVYEPDLVDPFPEAPAQRLARRGLLRRIQSTQAEMNRLQAMQYEAVAEFTSMAEDRGIISRIGPPDSPRNTRSETKLARWPTKST